MNAAFEESLRTTARFCKNNNKITDGTIALMNILPSPQARRLFADTLLKKETQQLEYFLKEDFKPRWPESQEEAEKLFKTILMDLQITYDPFTAYRVHDLLRAIYTIEELNGPVLQIQDFVLPVIEKNIKQLRESVGGWSIACYQSWSGPERRKVLIGDLKTG